MTRGFRVVLCLAMYLGAAFVRVEDSSAQNGKSASELASAAAQMIDADQPRYLEKPGEFETVTASGNIVEVTITYLDEAEYSRIKAASDQQAYAMVKYLCRAKFFEALRKGVVFMSLYRLANGSGDLINGEDNFEVGIDWSNCQSFAKSRPH